MRILVFLALCCPLYCLKAYAKNYTPSRKTFKSRLHSFIHPLDTSQLLGKPTRNPEHILQPGTWSIHLLFSGEYVNDSDVDLVFANIHQLKRRSILGQANVGTFIKEGLLVGGSVSLMRANSFFLGDIMQGFTQRYVQEDKFGLTIAPFIRNYVPLTHQHTLYFVNQTELPYTYAIAASETFIGGSNGGFTNTQNASLAIEQKFRTTQGIGLRLVPGLVIFLTPRFSLEANASIFEVFYKTEQIKYQYDKNRPPAEQNIKTNRNNTSFNADFNFNILKIGIGFAYYL